MANKNTQFSLQERISNENGQMHLEGKHYPIFVSNLSLVHNLSPIVDYSLICNNQKTYNGLNPNTKYYVLMWQDID